ncbi:hypothetical protein FZEAL_10948, partial [Fusarium zealandicum]
MSGYFGKGNMDALFGNDCGFNFGNEANNFNGTRLQDIPGGSNTVGYAGNQQRVSPVQNNNGFAPVPGQFQQNQTNNSAVDPALMGANTQGQQQPMINTTSAAPTGQAPVYYTPGNANSMAGTPVSASGAQFQQPQQPQQPVQDNNNNNNNNGPISTQNMVRFQDQRKQAKELLQNNDVSAAMAKRQSMPRQQQQQMGLQNRPMYAVQPQQHMTGVSQQVVYPHMGMQQQQQPSQVQQQGFYPQMGMQQQPSRVQQQQPPQAQQQRPNNQQQVRLNQHQAQQH